MKSVILITVNDEGESVEACRLSMVSGEVVSSHPCGVSHMVLSTPLQAKDGSRLVAAHGTRFLRELSQHYSGQRLRASEYEEHPEIKLTVVIDVKGAVDQPRVPAGSSHGGEFGSTHGGEGSQSKPEEKPIEGKMADVPYLVDHTSDEGAIKSAFEATRSEVDKYTEKTRETKKQAEVETNYAEKHRLFAEASDAATLRKVALHDAVTYRQLPDAVDKVGYLNARALQIKQMYEEHQAESTLIAKLVADGVVNKDAYHKGAISADIIRSAIGREGDPTERIAKAQKKSILGITENHIKAVDAFYADSTKGNYDLERERREAHRSSYYGEPVSVSNKLSALGEVQSNLPSKVTQGGGDDTIKAFMSNSQVAIQVKEKNLNAIISAGQMKNVFEGGKGGVQGGKKDYKETRRDIEDKQFGIPLEAGGESRPIYGYLEHPDRIKSKGGQISENYGTVQVVLKSEVKARSTYTVGDSLDDSGAFGRVVGAVNNPISHLGITDNHWSGPIGEGKPVVNVKAASISSNWSVEMPYSGTTRPRYIEAQVYGGIKLTDIHEIRIPKGIALTDTQKKKLAKSGVNIIEIQQAPLDTFYSTPKTWDQALSKD